MPIPDKDFNAAYDTAYRANEKAYKRLAESPAHMTTLMTATVWGLDFVRALIDMPNWRRWIVLVFMGADARHELNGLSETLKVLGYDISEGNWRTR
mgnify:CR=1 FL=1